MGNVCHINMVLFPGGGGGDNLPWYFSLIVKFVWGGGEALPYGIVSPMGKFCHGILPGGGLPYGIPSGGTFAIWYKGV